VAQLGFELSDLSAGHRLHPSGAQELAKATIEGRASPSVARDLIIDLRERMMLTDSLPDFAAANGGVYGEVK
jgi:hypothetical protein